MPSTRAPLLSPDAVCDWLSITRSHLKKLTERGELSYLKVGQLVRYDPEEIATYLRRQRRRNVP